MVLGSLRPLDIVSYLRARGWNQQGEGNSIVTFWTRRIGGEEFELLLPMDRSLRDFPELLSNVVDRLGP